MEFSSRRILTISNNSSVRAVNQYPSRSPRPVLISLGLGN